MSYYIQYNHSQINMVYKKIYEAARKGNYKIDINDKLDSSTLYFFSNLNYYVHPTRKGQRFEWHRKADYSRPLNRKILDCLDAYNMEDITNVSLC